MTASTVKYNRKPEDLPLEKLGASYTDKASAELLRYDYYHDSADVIPAIWSRDTGVEPYPKELPGIIFLWKAASFYHSYRHSSPETYDILVDNGCRITTERNLQNSTDPEVKEIWNRLVEIAANDIRRAKLAAARKSKKARESKAKKLGVSVKDLAAVRKKERELRQQKKKEEEELDNFNRLFETSKELTRIQTLTDDVMKKLEYLRTAEKIPKITYVDNKLKQIGEIRSFLKSILDELSA